MFNRALTIAFLIALPVWTLKASTLVWDRTEAHIEMKPEQEEVRTTYTVTNRGEKTLRIARIKTSCGCTGSIIDKKIIEPGESSRIVATFHKGKRQGLNRNKLQVFLDNQPEPVATLLMNVQIPTLIKTTPQIVYWNSESSRSARRIQIKLDERYIDEILRIDYDPSKLIVTELPGDPKTETARILQVEPKDYDTLYRGTVAVYGSGPDKRKADTRIHVFVQP